MFLSTWRGKTVSLPLYSGGEYDFTVDWGDGSTDRIKAWDQKERIHEYEEGGKHEVRIWGLCDGFNFEEAKSLYDHRNALVSIGNWGTVRILSAKGCFKDCARLTTVDAPDLEGITDMSQMFFAATSFDGDVSRWNTSAVTDMREMFRHAHYFNGDVSEWDTASVTKMAGMFKNTWSFNGDRSGWNTDAVTDMENTPRSLQRRFSTKSFNENVNGWNMATVADMCCIL